MVLAEALGRLPERDREALILRYVADLSLREIAAITGRTSAAVGMRLTRAKRKLRNLLEDDDD